MFREDAPGSEFDESRMSDAQEERAQILADSIEEEWFAWWRDPDTLDALWHWLDNQGRTPPETFWTLPWLYEDAYQTMTEQLA